MSIFVFDLLKNDISTEEVIPDVVQATFKYSDSYMKIVTKTIRDMIPKAITLYIVKELDTFIREDLVNKILPHSKDGYVRLCAIFYTLKFINHNNIFIYCVWVLISRHRC